MSTAGNIPEQTPQTQQQPKAADKYGNKLSNALSTATSYSSEDAKAIPSKDALFHVAQGLKDIPGSDCVMDLLLRAGKPLL